MIAKQQLIEVALKRLKKQVVGNGGLVVKKVKKRSTEVIRYISERSNKSFPIIGVGGIHSAEDAIEKLKAGASLVRYTRVLYTKDQVLSKD